jgi:hypothetical protein
LGAEVRRLHDALSISANASVQKEFASLKKITGAKYGKDLQSFREGRCVPNPELTQQSPP